MKTFFDDIKSNVRQGVDILILLISIAVPWVINLPDYFKKYLEETPISPDNVFWYIVISSAPYIASLAVLLFVLWIIQKSNRDFVMNRRNVYHDYRYMWYWFCAKVLGIKKCNLILVPIYMQFLLVIRGTFDEYPLNEDEYPPIDKESEIRVTKYNDNGKTDEVNLILEDTYVIKKEQIPEEKEKLFTIKISRNTKETQGRHFSQEFIEQIINCVRGFSEVQVMNVYATTNPMNTKHIAQRAFSLGNRGNINHLYVFQQRNGVDRTFESRGHKIY